MTDLYRVRSDWTGFLGGPGVSTMYFLDVATAVASVHTFWEDIRGCLPSEVYVKVENSGDIIDDATGDITDSWTATAETGTPGEDTGQYAAPSGACVNWLTDTVVNHRRLRGRTFLVPLGGDHYQNNGTLSDSTMTTIQAAATALVDAQSASFVVWHRGSGSDGSNGLITRAVLHDFTAVLRSRRD